MALEMGLSSRQDLLNWTWDYPINVNLLRKWAGLSAWPCYFQGQCFRNNGRRTKRRTGRMSMTCNFTIVRQETNLIPKGLFSFRALEWVCKVNWNQLKCRKVFTCLENCTFTSCSTTTFWFTNSAGIEQVRVFKAVANQNGHTFFFEVGTEHISTTKTTFSSVGYHEALRGFHLPVNVKCFELN